MGFIFCFFLKIGYAVPLAPYVPVVTEERSHVRWASYCSECNCSWVALSEIWVHFVSVDVSVRSSDLLSSLFQLRFWILFYKSEFLASTTKPILWSMSEKFPICINHTSENFWKVMCVVILCESFVAATRKKKKLRIWQPFCDFYSCLFSTN